MRLITFVSVLAISSLTEMNAHPVAFKGAISAISSNTQSQQDHLVHYSLSHRVSTGMRLIHSKTSQGDRYSVFPQLSFLLKRWNHSDFQANIYVFGGFGYERIDYSASPLKQGWASVSGGEADIEDRRFYFSTQWESFNHSKLEWHFNTKNRVGVAPYLAEFDEPASWLILQHDYDSLGDGRHTVTPLFRIFYRRFLLEAGASHRGELLLNFMAHF